MKITVYLISTLLVCTLTICSSCQKQIDYSPSIDSLRNSVLSLEQRCDSLSAALAKTNLNLGNLTTQVDSITIQIAVINSKIITLTQQLTTTNANISLINSQISTLNQQLNSLISQLNAIIAQLTSMPTALTYGLVAWYPFTGSAVDSSGNGNNGTVYGATLTTDRFGNTNSAYYFNGSSYISVPSSQSLNCNSAITISCWAKQSSNSSTEQVLVSRERHLDGMSYKLATLNNNLGLGLNNDTTILGNPASNLGGITTSGGLTSGVWQHLIGTWDGQTLRLYINGNLSLSQSVLFSTNNGLLLNSSMNLYIGKWMTTLSSWGFNYYTGSIDEVRIYNRALSQAEINYLASH